MRTAEDAVPGLARAFAWGGALLFVASLSFFLYSYVVTFGERVAAQRTDGAGRAIGINAALFTLFALHHSVFARLPVRAWVARLVPSCLERSWYVWVASALFISVLLLWQPVPGIAWRAEGAWRWVLLGVQAAGIWLTLHGAAVLDFFELSGLRQHSRSGRPMEFKASGPYRWVRHPIYTGWFLVVFAVPTMTMTRLVFAAISSAYVLIAIPLEERSIRSASGGAYDTYSKHVRWKVIPGLY
jgi:protein-S-isoprenylcysteine O-methyltransferase Ste14